jgi:N6-L-threonylcarbamoyladenine synthase
MLILGIESTCDETACAIVRDGKEILSNVVASQALLHEVYGGVVPELACRRHIDMIIPVIEEGLAEAGVSLSDIDAIAVAHGPGLVGALLIGVNAAKSLALATNKPFVAVNHVEAHLYAAMMSMSDPLTLPALGLILSGGHTALLSVAAIDKYILLGQTVDDAIGEAFDKVAKMLHLPYPGGPHIERLAQNGDPERYHFKGGVVKGRPLDFSFSGLKTSVLYTLRGQNCANASSELTEQDKCDAAASFQKAAFQDIITKTRIAVEKIQAKEIFFGGGVTNNQALRKTFATAFPHLQLRWPALNLSLDNAAMIAGLAYHKLKRFPHGDSYDIEPATRIPFCKE